MLVASLNAITTGITGGEDFDENEVLLGYQRRWIADESPLKIAEKSRRTGITWAEAADAALTASKAKSAGGTNHFYVGSNKEMAREFIDAAAMWAKAYDLAAADVCEEVLVDDDKDILTFVIYFASGFKVQALSSNPSNLRGMQATSPLMRPRSMNAWLKCSRLHWRSPCGGRKFALSAPTTAPITCSTN